MEWRLIIYCCIAFFVVINNVKANELKYDFRIPALQANEALILLAQQSDTSLLYSHNQVQHIQSNWVVGVYTLPQALEILLKDTGITGSINHAGVLTISEIEPEITAKPAIARQIQGENMPEQKQIKQSVFKKIAGVLLAGLFGASSASAQQAETNVSTILEEIVVTAQKREENLQNVAIAITAYTQDQLEKNNITDLSRLDIMTPGLTFGMAGIAPQPTIRGVPTPGVQVDTDPSLGFHVDGAYRTRGGQAMAAMFDLERVEIHRGPQGTLFGRNTTGGNINIITKAPEKEFGARFTVGYGDYNHLTIDGMVNVPISDQFQARLAVKHEDSDPYHRNIFLGGDEGANDKDRTVGRLSLRFQPNEDIDAILRLSYWDQGGQSTFNGYKIGGTQLASGITLADLPAENTALSRAPASPNFKGNFLSPFGTPIVSYNPRGGRFDNPTDGDEYRANDPNRLNLKEKALNFTVNWDFASVRLTSITNYSDYKAFRVGDSDFSENDFETIAFTTNSDTFSQEVRLSSLETTPLEWQIGFYYLDDESFDNFSFFFEDDNPLQGILGNHFIDRSRTEITESWAIFGQASYFLTDALRVTFGGRYTEDDKTFDQLEFRSDGTVLRVDSKSAGNTLNETFKEFTWKFGIDHFWADNNLLYVSVSTGFRSGGFNGTALGAADTLNLTIPQSFGTERALSFEVGAKNVFLDKRLRLNTSAYYAIYDDAHVNLFDSVSQSGYSENAAKVIAWGVEYEATAVVTAQLTLTATGHFMEAYYDTYENCRDQMALLTIDCTGNEIVRSPRIKFTLTGEYDIPLGEMGTLTPRVVMAYSGSYHNTPFNYAMDDQDSFTRTDVNLIWRAIDGHWSANAFINNIEDEVPLIYGVVGSAGGMFSNYGMPRTYGVRVTYNF